MPSIAIVGAGPGMGLAIARAFGSQGFDVALLARNRAKLHGPAVGNVNAAAAALRNWVVNLHKELADSGIQAAHVAIDVTLGVTPVLPGFPTATPEEVAPVYWELHTNRDEAEHLFTASQGA